MSRKREAIFSRRALVQIVALGGAAVLTLQPVAAFGATQALKIEKYPGAVDEYVTQTSSRGFTDLSGIHAEFREAASRFPFDLPPGWAFPSESNFRDQTSGERWERGIAVAGVYMFWQSAVATEAHNAQMRGDESMVRHLLDVIELGYNSPVRRAVLEDPARLFVQIALGGARSGDFTALRTMTAY